MLAREYHLPARQRLLSATTQHSPFFILKTAPTSYPHSRFGVVISKKVDKRATKRNQIRRCLMHAVTPLIKTNTTPLDILVILKPQSAQATDEELSTSLLFLLNKKVV